MQQFCKSAVAFIAALAGASYFAGAASAATLTLDNFEEYSPGQAIATGAFSTPWGRFGSVEDNLYATTASAQDGTLGAEVPVGITGTGFAQIQKSLGGYTNISQYASASFLAESLTASNNGTASTAAVSLVIDDNTAATLKTTYQSDVPQLLTGSSKSYTFLIDDADMYDADDESTPETLAQVLADATYVGLKYTSPSGASTFETLAIDDFTLATAPVTVPEPATAGLLLVGAVATGMLRRRAM